MGRNSKARRDARKRKRPSGRQGGNSAAGAGPFGWTTGRAEEPTVDPVAVAELHLTAQVRRLGPAAKPAEALARAASLRRACGSIAPTHLGRALRELTDRVLDSALDGGWGPAALAEAADRVLGEGQLELLTARIEGARRRKGFVGPDWDAELGELPPARTLDPRSDDDLAAGMRLAALLAALPRAADDAVAATVQGGAPAPEAGSRAEAKLAQVRALLAKAESTPYPDEAESLSAKAQELISRYSLELLVQAAGGSASDRSSDATYRRLWLDAPYVTAKANLVNEVAAANRCRCVLDPRLGLCTMVGSPFDLDAVELMVTSLLTQAQRAMLAHGSARDSHGATRTRSFRQSFLVSFAVHIGERLRATSAETVAASEDAALLPAIVKREEEVDQLTERLFPAVVEKETRVSNAAGWAGGRAAAELAQLDLYGRLPDDAPSEAAQGSLN